MPEHSFVVLAAFANRGHSNASPSIGEVGNTEIFQLIASKGKGAVCFQNIPNKAVIELVMDTNPTATGNVA